MHCLSPLNAQLPSAADRVLISVNPHSGSRARTEQIEQLTSMLAARGFAVGVFSKLDEIAAAAREHYAAGRLRAVIAAGGDGTVAELVNRTAPGVPIAVFPLGTANLLAAYLGCSMDAGTFTETIAEGWTIQLDAGQANGRVFLLMVGCGFDADVVQRLHEQRSGHINYWTWAKPILSTIRNYEYPELRVWYNSAPGVGNDLPSMLSARWAFVVNLPCYIWGLPLAPRAVGTDGVLNLCAFDQGSFWHGLRYLGSVALRRHLEMSECTSGLATRLRIESDQPVPYQLDGDPGGMLPLEIDVLPRRLTLIGPATRIAALAAAGGTAAAADEVSRS